MEPFVGQQLMMGETISWLLGENNCSTFWLQSSIQENTYEPMIGDKYWGGGWICRWCVASMICLSYTPQRVYRGFLENPSLGYTDELKATAIPFVVAGQVLICIGSWHWVSLHLFWSPSSWSGWCCECERERARQADVMDPKVSAPVCHLPPPFSSVLQRPAQFWNA